jgi:hypothetical protein
MKRLIALTIFGLASIAMSGCQNGGSSQSTQDKFAAKTHRTYNPETETFEQSPPFGKQSNKAVNE